MRFGSLSLIFDTRLMPYRPALWITVIVLIVAMAPASVAASHSIETHGVSLIIPEPSDMSPASARLASGMRALATLPGEQQLALFVKKNKSPNNKLTIEMVRVATSLNGKEPPITLGAFSNRIEKVKKF